MSAQGVDDGVDDGADDPDRWCGPKPVTRRSLGRAAAGCVGALFCPPLAARPVVAGIVGRHADGCTDVDLRAVAPGESLTVPIAGKRIIFRRRTDAEIAAARAVALSDLKDPQADEQRVERSEWLIVEGACTHLGCPLLEGLGAYGGWLCPCHASVFDTSGRVRRGPAPKNLPVPRYTFVANTIVRIGCAGASPH